MKDNSKWIIAPDGRTIITETFHHNVSDGVTFDGGPTPEKVLMCAAPELLKALEYAAELIPIARRYFPKSIENSNTFQLENTCATINTAIHKATASPTG